MAYRFSVGLFIEHFRKMQADIESVASPFHRKILYAAALDPLSRAAFGPRKKGDKHREWIVRLLTDLTDWKEAKLLSLPQLKLLLCAQRRSRFRLHREVNKRLKEWPTGHYIPISGSPTLADLRRYAAPEEFDALDSCQYVQLFYTYRNNLIHEFREPGYGTDWGRPRKSPFYTSSIYGPWELVFPVGFFSTLFSQSLEGVQSHLLRTRTNPHSNFDFGSLWRAK